MQIERIGGGVVQARSLSPQTQGALSYADQMRAARAKGEAAGIRMAGFPGPGVSDEVANAYGRMAEQMSGPDSARASMTLDLYFSPGYSTPDSALHDKAGAVRHLDRLLSDLDKARAQLTARDYQYSKDLLTNFRAYLT